MSHEPRQDLGHIGPHHRPPNANVVSFCVRWNRRLDLTRELKANLQRRIPKVEVPVLSSQGRLPIPPFVSHMQVGCRLQRQYLVTCCFNSVYRMTST
jgi:hypothetical protein